MGVAYYRDGQAQKALRAFKYAMERSDDTSGHDYLLSARNLVQVCSERVPGETVLSLTRPLIESDEGRLLLTSDELSDVYAFHIHALRRSGLISEMAELSRELLKQPDLAEPLRHWLTAHLIAHLALFEHDSDAVLSFIGARRGWLENADPHDGMRKALLFNNVAFALAEFGMVADADKFLGRIQNRIHVDAYPTATLGLIQLRKGHMEKAVELYEEAIHIASSREEKLRIRQKLNLELGRYWMSRQPSKARRLFEKVVSEKDGESGLVRQARRELLTLIGE